MSEHYLDNSATTVVSEKSAQKALFMMTTEYGNPSSLHKKGLSAEREIESARKIIAASLSVNATEIFFTSGSTESNNTVIFGTISARRHDGSRIVTTAVEHSSVYEACKKAERDGYEVVYISPDKNGVVSAKDICDAVDDKTILVSVMAVNNETGAIMPIKEIGSMIKRKNPSVIFHCDAVQAFGKIKLKPSKWNVDMMNVSSHKVHGPKGVGAMYIKKGVRITPLLYGGEQQRKIRPGTEAAPLISAFGVAVSEFDIDKNYAYITELRDYLVSRLSTIDDIHINSSDSALPYIVNISTNCIKSETMLHYLEQNNIFVSSSSACAKGKRSYVLSAMGLSDRLIDTSLRISFSKYNTKDDIDAFVDSLKKGMSALARLR